MKQFTHILALLCCIALPLCAQDGNKKYLAGAVPEVNGKVTFTKTFSIPGMARAEVYDRMHQWIEKHMAQNENNSILAYADEEQGIVMGNGEEWLVFTSSALSLDRARIIYIITARCGEETCTLTIDRMRFIYKEGAERYSAEEMITDKLALNKAQTKLVPGYAKWRKKTIDFVNDLCLEAANVLSAADVQQTLNAKEQQEQEETALVNSGTTVITPTAAKPIETAATATEQAEAASAPTEQTQAVEAETKQAVEEATTAAETATETATETVATAAETATETATETVATAAEAATETASETVATAAEAATEAASAESGQAAEAVTTATTEQTEAIAARPHYISVSPDELTPDALRSSDGTLVIVLGAAPNEVKLTPGAGGSLGKVNGKAAVFTILSPDQPYEEMENAESYTVGFYPNGATEPSLVLTCRKQPSPAVIEGMPRTYIGEIVSATVYQP